jgi:hypothetical protein
MRLNLGWLQQDGAWGDCNLEERVDQFIECYGVERLRFDNTFSRR